MRRLDFRGNKKLAERVGFEPTVPVKAHLISSQARSTTPAPLRDWAWAAQKDTPRSKRAPVYTMGRGLPSPNHGGFASAGGGCEKSQFAVDLQGAIRIFRASRSPASSGNGPWDILRDCAVRGSAGIRVPGRRMKESPSARPQQRGPGTAP